MNPEKSIFWIATGIIFVFAGVMPTLTSQTDLAVEGIHPLGYPAYFGVMLTVSRTLGFLVIAIPQIQRPLKKRAYKGLTFDFIAASLSDWVVDGAVDTTGILSLSSQAQSRFEIDQINLYIKSFSQ